MTPDAALAWRVRHPVFFSFLGVERFRTQNIQSVWKDSVTFSPGFQKSSIEYEVTTHYTYRPLAAILEFTSRGSGANALELV